MSCRSFYCSPVTMWLEGWFNGSDLSYFLLQIFVSCMWSRFFVACIDVIQPKMESFLLGLHSSVIQLIKNHSQNLFWHCSSLAMTSIGSPSLVLMRNIWQWRICQAVLDFNEQIYILKGFHIFSAQSIFLPISKSSCMPFCDCRSCGNEFICKSPQVSTSVSLSYDASYPSCSRHGTAS